MNNKPVAWMFEYGTDRGDAVNGISWYPNVHFKKPELSGLIRNIEPLYTHPVKELTDEEIYACFHQYFVLGEPKPTHYELEYEDLVDFARAILRKVQEK